MNKQDIIIKNFNKYEIDGEERNIIMNVKLKQDLRRRRYKMEVDSNNNILTLEKIPIEDILKEIIYRKVYNQPGVFPDIRIEFNNVDLVIRDIKSS